MPSFRNVTRQDDGFLTVTAIRAVGARKAEVVETQSAKASIKADR